MRSIRTLVAGAFLALALAGCGGGLASLGITTPGQATSVAAAEQAFTVAANLETVWLKSGKATPAQASQAKALREAVYSDLVVARTAVANNDSAAIATGLALYNQALPVFTAYIANHGGAKQ